MSERNEVEKERMEKKEVSSEGQRNPHFHYFEDTCIFTGTVISVFLVSLSTSLYSRRLK